MISTLRSTLCGKSSRWLLRSGLVLVALAGLIATSAMKRPGGKLVVYCGRGEELIHPLVAKFQASTGIDVQVRYGGTAELAATILEEGRNSPADVFFAQDAGALGALNRHGRLALLPAELTDRVPGLYRSPDNSWLGVSGRARVVVYNTNRLREGNLPEDIFGFTDPIWKGRIGWAPENGSFQSFVTALRIREGDARTLEWLKGIKANAPRVYAKNSAIVAAVAAGEIDAGFVNHYYLFTARKTRPNLAAANYYFPGEASGNLMNVAGVGLLKTSRQPDAALAFIQFLLSEEAQTYFARETAEYPVVEGVELPEELQTIRSSASPDIDLNLLNDLDGTLELIHRAGIL